MEVRMRVEVEMQATICMRCRGTGKLIARNSSEVDCEQCRGTGIVWLRVLPDGITRLPADRNVG
jgi:DnaJ-class molecular chaperone